MSPEPLIYPLQSPPPPGEAVAAAPDVLWLRMPLPMALRTRTLGALANLSGELSGTGEVLFTRNEGLLLGELDKEKSERAEAIVQSIDRAGVRAIQVTDILSREWSKFVAWAGWALLAIVVRAKSWQMMRDTD